KFNDGIIDTFTNTEMIKQYNQEDYFIKKGNKLLVSNLLAKNNLLNFDAKLTGLKSMALDVFNVILFTLGSYLIIKGSFVTGTLLMYNSIISFTVDPILSITNLQSVLAQGKEAENLLLNLLGSDLRFYGKEKFPTNEKNIALKTRNLQFSFNSREPLLDGINITIENQKNIALTGGNGSGKSTLGKLLSRSYLPDNGVIEINGIDISSISEEEYKTNVVYVGSSEDIISGTIIENISLGKNLDLKKLEKIAHDIN
ncbi:ATP-binding cassette domain-containing protein, partial [Pseudomonas monteilii]|nr:ATP-binding cassette domain-containing protein [Pseudomonas monteilii]